jgi:hypothetical protein
MSVAEKTMQHHQAHECWGCGSPQHVYSDRTGTIFCPRASKPEVKAKFDATCKDFQECHGTCTKKTNEKRKSSNISQTLTTLIHDRKQLEQLKTLLSLSKKPKMAASPSSQEFVPFPTFLCLPTDLASKPLLPISMDTNVPYFLLPIGQPRSEPSFKISVAYDTCAVLNLGWAGFHLAIAKNTLNSSKA